MKYLGIEVMCTYICIGIYVIITKVVTFSERDGVNGRQ
jgi:hypothetical protein